MDFVWDKGRWGSTQRWGVTLTPRVQKKVICCSSADMKQWWNVFFKQLPHMGTEERQELTDWSVKTNIQLQGFEFPGTSGKPQAQCCDMTCIPHNQTEEQQNKLWWFPERNPKWAFVLLAWSNNEVSHCLKLLPHTIDTWWIGRNWRIEMWRQTHNCNITQTEHQQTVNSKKGIHMRQVLHHFPAANTNIQNL